ncbi:MAG: MTAP family purine nucleoside phosphorylase, partial [Armatimonadota bacterium]
MRIGVIGGTGVDELPELTRGRVVQVATRFGSAVLVETQFAGAELVFVPRHGPDHSVPPSLVNYRAQTAALKKTGVRRVIGVCAVGSLTSDLPPGSFAVLVDFIDLTKRRVSTFFDEPGQPVAHTDFTQPYCPELSKALVEACGARAVQFEPRAIYAGVEGPRYETPAEVKLYASWGAHVVGMTNVPEVVLAREAGLCYG